MKRHKDAPWLVNDRATTEEARLAVLMDLRDEMKSVNDRLDYITGLLTAQLCNIRFNVEQIKQRGDKPKGKRR